MEYLVYLGGPIRGHTSQEAKEWRDYVIKRLASWPQIRCMSPLRNQSHVDLADPITGVYDKDPLGTGRSILVRDRFDVTRAHLLFFNFLKSKMASIGSAMEIGWGDLLHKPMVMVMEPDNTHRHCMLTEASGFILTDLDLAIDLIPRILLPREVGQLSLPKGV